MNIDLSEINYKTVQIHYSACYRDGLRLKLDIRFK